MEEGPADGPQFHQRAGPDDAGLPEGQVEDRILPHQRAGVGHGGPGPGGALAGLEGDDRFLGDDPGRGLEKFPPPLHALQVQDDDAGLGIVLQVLKDVHHVHVPGVAHVDGLAHPPGEGGGPHLKGPALGHHGQGRRSGLPGNVDEGGGEARKGIEHPHGVGPQKPGAVLPGQGRELRLQLLAPGVGVGETLADHHHPLDAVLDTLLKGRHHPLPSQGDDRQVRDLRQIGHPA